MADYLVNAVEITSAQVAFEVLINDGRLLRISDQPDGNWAFKGNPLLIQGTNELTVSVRPLDGQTSIAPNASVQLKIYEGVHGVRPGEDAKVHEFAWFQAATAVTATDYRIIHQKEFPTQAAQARWSWQDATPYAESDRALIVSLVGALHAALVSRDYDATAALNVVRDTDLARAFDVSLETLLRADRMQLTGLMAQADWDVLPLDAAAVELHPRAQGRLVEVTGPNRSHPLIVRGGGTQIELPTTVSNLNRTNLNGKGWTIVR